MGLQSIRVKIYLTKQYNKELIRKLPDYDGLLRLLCMVRFKKSKAWTEAQYAILDTGAHTSLLPFSLWQEIEASVLTDHFVRGLVPKEECKIDVKIGWITGKLVDEKGNETNEINFRAFLAFTDKIPLIVGFKDLLEKLSLIFDPIAGTGYLEVR